jgi:hypothetical protein
VHATVSRLAIGGVVVVVVVIVVVIVIRNVFFAILIDDAIAHPIAAVAPPNASDC